MMGRQRPVARPANHQPAQLTPGMGYISPRHPGARQSPVPPNMINAPTQVNSQMQRTSPSNRKTPPMMNLGHMTEVPYPSQASMPEETPIIRMSRWKFWLDQNIVLFYFNRILCTHAKQLIVSHLWLQNPFLLYSKYGSIPNGQRGYCFHSTL